MSIRRTFGIAVLTAAFPTMNFAQTLTIEIGEGTAHIQPSPNVACNDGTKGFVITQSTVNADLKATEEFSLIGTGRPRVRKGLEPHKSNKHFRPAVKTLESKKTIIDVARKQMRTIGSESLRAKGSLTLTGCRAGNTLRFLTGHLKVSGVVASYGIRIDDKLQNLIGANARVDQSESEGRTGSVPKSEVFLQGLTSSMRDMSFRGEALKFLSVSFDIDERRFPAVESDGPDLSARVKVLWSSVLAEQPSAIQGTN